MWPWLYLSLKVCWLLTFLSQFSNFSCLFFYQCPLFITLNISINFIFTFSPDRISGKAKWILSNGLIHQWGQSNMHKFTYTHSQFCHISTSGIGGGHPGIDKQAAISFYSLVQNKSYYLMQSFPTGMPPVTKSLQVFTESLIQFSKGVRPVPRILDSGSYAIQMYISFKVSFLKFLQHISS